MKFRRTLAFLLVLCMTLSLLPAQIQAAETSQATVNSNNMTIEGTNGFGALLSAEIAESQAASEEAAMEYQAGYSITALAFDGNTATVTYDALEEATLVVGVYTEDGLQLLASGKTTVSPEETEATVTIGGTMPEYFYACAYLLDAEDFVPLCEDYTTPMYTQEMQALLASTVDDYDAERVYNLDEDTTTNFAVFAEDTIIVDEQAGVNTVASIDDENLVYVIENADETITALAEGDILAYPYGDGDILLVKVASVSVDGTTATITGGDLEMNEAFQAVKIEAVTSELTVDPDYQADGITRLDAPVQPRSWDTGIEIGESFTYAFDVYGRDISSGGAVKLTGSLTIGITAAVTVYSTKSYTRVENKLDFSQHYIVTAEGKGAFEADTPFEVFTLSPFVGVTVTVKPKLILEFSCAITIDYAYTASMGSYINYDGNTWSAHTIRENPEPELDFKFEGTIFLGISLTPTVELIKGKLARVALEAKLGVELKGTQSLVDWERNLSCLHECNVCVDYDLSFVCSMEPSITLVNNPNLSLKAKLVDIKFKFLDAYWCQDRDEFRLGNCPYISYRVTMGVIDESYRPLTDVSIHLSDGTVHNTGKQGAAVVYLPNGTYTASTLSNDITASAKFTVADDSRGVVLIASEEEPETGLPGDVSEEIITDYGTVVDFGTCGDAVYWFLTESGTLIIAGTGDMWNFDPLFDKDHPWYDSRDSIINVQVLEGVTSIGEDAFYKHSNLADIDLPDTLTKIRLSAFYCCASLTDLYIPAAVSSIGGYLGIGYTFYGCNSLQAIRVSGDNLYYASDDAGILYNKEKTTLLCAPGGISGDIVIPDSVTSIGEDAFHGCHNITGITIPDSVTRIDSWAFEDCSSLTAIIIPDSVTVLEGYGILSDCSSLGSVVLPSGLTKIPNSIFRGCSSLSNITIPESVTAIGSHAFSNCSSLTEIDLPEGVVSIGASAFFNCDGLTEIVLPEGVVAIEDNAFDLCDNLSSINFSKNLASIGKRAFCDSALTEVILPEGLTSIGEWAFYDCERITKLSLPSTLTDIGEHAFAGCDGLTEVVIPESMTVIGYYALAFCYYLKSVTIPNSVTTIGEGAFRFDLSLPSITIPESVTQIEKEAFYNCKALKKITFLGDAPAIAANAFSLVTSTAYYPAGNATWTSDVMQNYGGTVTWVPYTLDGSGNMVINEAAAVTVVPSGEAIPAPEEEVAPMSVEETVPVLAEEAVPETSAEPASFTDDLVIGEQPADGMTPDAIYGGEYATDVLDTYTLKTATFSGLVPGAEYVMLALVSIETGDILAADNLLGILQATAGDDGTLVFRYIQRVSTDISYVVACGPSNKNLKDATITFPKMTANGELQVVKPMVVYGGETLVEGVDYEITGIVDFTEPGEYTCQIRGIHNYTGTVTCTYTVTETGGLPGDINGDGEINIFDANLIVAYYNETIDLTEAQLLAADVNGNGEIDIFDANLIVAFYNETIEAFPKA